MNGQFQLYKVHQEITDLIESQIDQETGELNQVANAHFDALQLKREDAIHQLCLVNLESKAKADAVANEIKRLAVIKKSLDNMAEASERIISKELAEGETYQFENAKISYRKSEAVEVDETLDLSQLAFDQPELVKLSYAVNKTEVKKMAKEGKPIPEGILIVKKNNLVIK